MYFLFKIKKVKPYLSTHASAAEDTGLWIPVG